jgi:hypothetical protein
MDNISNNQYSNTNEPTDKQLTDKPMRSVRVIFNHYDNLMDEGDQIQKSIEDISRKLELVSSSDNSDSDIIKIKDEYNMQLATLKFQHLINHNNLCDVIAEYELFYKKNQ